MKAAITAATPNIDARQEPRFGRAPYFVVLDTKTMEWTAVENPGASARGGAAIYAAQFLVEQGVEAVVCAGNYGPNAYDSLKTAGIKMYANPSGGVIREVGKMLEAGKLSQVTTPGSEEIGEAHYGRHRGAGRR